MTDALTAFRGDVRQTPPAYSAVKWVANGAYDLVRKGRRVDMPSRIVCIHSIEIVAYAYPELTLDIICGTGTYIRTLGIDLAKALGTVAVMTALTQQLLVSSNLPML